ncbi:MAG: phage virion morphogenesis protein [Xanthomonadales bacterium]|nr:phage virion morphogenesis protein [Xanthomonadales bacterium]
MMRIDLDDSAVQAAFARQVQAATQMQPLMQEIGEFLAETTKQRFQASTAPDGSRWAPNTETTYINLLGRFKSSYGKKGKISASGSRRAAGKKPLIGETSALSTTINYRAGSDFVEIGSPMVYATVQQFGAKKHSFTGGKSPWGSQGVPSGAWPVLNRSCVRTRSISPRSAYSGCRSSMRLATLAASSAQPASTHSMVRWSVMLGLFSWAGRTPLR